jgi:Fur family peroxide stress response transcriptional regulator
MQTAASAQTRTFRELCADHGLAATHQRQVLYEVMHTMPGHPSPEEVYARVKKRIPAISLATVYKNIHLFVERGVLKEVSMHHGSLRVELNSHLHHHIVCSHCKTITDIEENDLGVLPALQRLPGASRLNAMPSTSSESVPRARRKNAADIEPPLTGLKNLHQSLRSNRGTVFPQ